MKDTFTVDFDRLAETLIPKRAYRLADVEHRLERVAYDLVRFRDNQDTDQLWKVENSPDGPVIVALYGDDGGTETEKQSSDWDAVPDKKAMHIYYKGEPLVSLSADQLGIPAKEFGVARRWLPIKLAQDEELQEALLGKVATPVRKLIVQRFPELTKAAALEDDDWEDEMDETATAQSQDYLGEVPLEDEEGDWNWDDESMEMKDLGDPFRPGGREGGRVGEGFDERLMPDETVEEPGDLKSIVSEVLSLFGEGNIDQDKAEEVLLGVIGKAAKTKASELIKAANKTE